MSRSILCGLIGAGIQRSLAPALQEEEARHHGIRMHYQLIDLDRSSRGVQALPGLIEAARLMGYTGLNITHPCKQIVMPLLDAISGEAQVIGAVNTIVREGDRLVGYNTDASGWSWGFRRALREPDLARVALLGAGGAGAACAYAVLQMGAERLAIFDCDLARAEALAVRLNGYFNGGRAQACPDGESALAGATGLIHATTTGMAKAPGTPLPDGLLRPAMWVAEVVYVPLETSLLRAARRLGCRTVDGGHMNVGQAIGAFKLFTGCDAEPARMDAHFRRLVSEAA
jgi:shikimate dehydrogenase